MDIFFCAQISVSAMFVRLDANTKEVSTFKVQFSLTMRTFHLSNFQGHSNFQLELFNLWYGTLKINYQENIREFYKCLRSNGYGQLKWYVHNLILVFYSTYLHEKTFSKVKYIRFHYRSALTDDYLQSNLTFH